MSERRASVKSLAKINLDLRVLHRRPDNFHELRTVFQTISLADKIDIGYETSRRTALDVEDELGIQNNLIIRAAEAALKAIKTSARVRFRLKKNIPMGAGLGGGSSNAAAVLLAIPVLAGKWIPGEQLIEIAAELGSDVPFFLFGGTAVAVDRGTEIYSLPETSEAPILVVAPGVHVATAEAYTALGRSLTLPDLSHKINSFQAFVRALSEMRPAEAASAFSANDFEPVVFGRYPQIKKIAAKLKKLAAGVRMTGSGSAVFALFRSKAERDLAQTELEGDRVFQDCRVIPASLVSRRRYQSLWRKQLAEHLTPNNQIWPPQSRYAR